MADEQRPRTRSAPADAQLETSATDPSEIAATRRAAAAHLERCGCTNIADAILVLSELVTNAVVHGGGATRVCISCDQTAIHINVFDRRADPPRPRLDNPVIGGRGLHIVEHLAQGWGSTADALGKQVWATLPRDRG
ncbi:MAG: ATP-binding protein [Acidimicrobiia bacterium]